MEPTTSFKQKQFNNTKKLAFWTLIWVLATALATFGPEFIWGKLPFHLRRRRFVFNHWRSHDFGQ